MGRSKTYLLLLAALATSVALLFLLHGPGEIAVASAIIGPGGGNLSCDNGRVLVDVPEGALKKETTVTCEATSVDELPKALREMPVIGQPYRLGPEGIAFKKPVTIKIALDSSLYNITANKTEVAPPILLTVNGRGEVELLQDQRVVVGPGEAYIEGNTSHFSWVVKRMGTIKFKMRPERISLPPESIFKADFEIWNLPAEELKEGKPTDIKYAAIWPEVWDIPVGTISSSKEIGILKSGEHYQTTFYYICHGGKGRYGASVGYWVPQVEEPSNLIDVSIWIRGTAECVDEKYLIPIITKEATITGVGGQQTIQAGTVKIMIIPHEISLSVGNSFEATFIIQNLPKGELEEGQLPTELKNVEIEPTAKGSLELEKDGTVYPLLRPGERWTKKFKFTCIREGSGYHSVTFSFKMSPEEAPDNYVFGGISGNGIAHCVEKGNATITGGVTIGTPGNRTCFYEGEQATFTAYGPAGNPVEVSWSSTEFRISQTGETLAFSPEAPGSGIISAAIGGVTTSLPVTVHKLPEEVGDYETLLSVDIKGESGEVYTLSPIKDIEGDSLYDSLYLHDSGPPVRIRLGKVLAGPEAGGVFAYEGKDYLVTSSENYRMSIAPAKVKTLLAYSEFEPKAALSLGEGLKAQYVVNDGAPSLHFIIDDAYVGFIDLEPAETAYEITSKVTALSEALRDKVFWATRITQKELKLAVASKSDIILVKDGEPALGWPWAKINDPDFPYHGLSLWKEEEALDRGEKRFIPGAPRTLIEYSMTGVLTIKHVKKPPC